MLVISEIQVQFQKFQLCWAQKPEIFALIKFHEFRWGSDEKSPFCWINLHGMTLSLIILRPLYPEPERIIIYPYSWISGSAWLLFSKPFLTVARPKPVVLKVVDIDFQGSIGPSNGSINSHRVEWESLNGQGSTNNCWDLLEHWSLQFKIIVNRARNANGVFQQVKQNYEGWSNLSYSSLKEHSIWIVFY